MVTDVVNLHLYIKGKYDLKSDPWPKISDGAKVRRCKLDPGLKATSFKF